MVISRPDSSPPPLFSLAVLPCFVPFALRIAIWRREFLGIQIFLLSFFLCPSVRIRSGTRRDSFGESPLDVGFLPLFQSQMQLSRQCFRLLPLTRRIFMALFRWCCNQIGSWASWRACTSGARRRVPCGSPWSDVSAPLCWLVWWFVDWSGWRVESLTWCVLWCGQRLSRARHSCRRWRRKGRRWSTGALSAPQMARRASPPRYWDHPCAPPGIIGYVLDRVDGFVHTV